MQQKTEEEKEKRRDVTIERKKEGKVTRRGARRQRRQTNRNKVTIDSKLMPDAISVPQVNKLGYSSALTAQSLKNVHVLTAPDYSYYLVDIQSILETFFDLEMSIRSLHRGGGWKRKGYYVHLFLRALVSRLQRVGIQTNLIALNQTEMLSQPGPLPIFVSHLINQFGICRDSNNDVVVAPYVTRDLLLFLLRVSDVISQPGHEDYETALNMDNYGDWVNVCYGELCWKNVIFGCAFRSIGVPFTPGRSLVEMSFQVGTSADLYNIKNGEDTMTGDQFIAASVDPTPLSATCVVGGPGELLDEVAGVHQAVRSAIDEQVNAFCAAIEPLQAADDAKISHFRVPREPMVVETEIMELRARYTVLLVSLSPEGSFAPLVVASDTDSSCTGSSTVKGLSELEYLFGIVLDQTVIYVSRDLIPFNFAAITRHKMKYRITALPFARAELLAKGMRECITRRKG